MGLWCRACALPSGIEYDLAIYADFGDPEPLAVVRCRYCFDCGATDTVE